jgi:hypothetical protein
MKPKRFRCAACDKLKPVNSGVMRAWSCAERKSDRIAICRPCAYEMNKILIGVKEYNQRKPK